MALAGRAGNALAVKFNNVVQVTELAGKVTLDWMGFFAGGDIRLEVQRIRYERHTTIKIR